MPSAHHQQLLHHLVPMKWVIAEAVALILVCFAHGGAVMRGRKKYFTREFLSQFDEVAKKEIGSAPDTNGYPDTGNGRYGKALPLPGWIDFNNIQRTHLNFIEMMPMLIFCILGAGYFNPALGQWLGLFIVFFRVVYFFGYIFNPNFRAFGSLPTLGIACYQMWIIGNGLLNAV